MLDIRGSALERADNQAVVGQKSVVPANVKQHRG
jgi:hypothetical protein